MGNAFVCLPQTLRLPSSHRNGVRLLAPAKLVNAVTAQVQPIYEAEGVKVAEVMLENPGTFLMPLPGASPATPLPAPNYHNTTATTAFFEALPADHQLEYAHTYLLLPMHKLHKRVSPQELAFFAHLAFHNTSTRAPSKAGGPASAHLNRVSPCEGLFAYTSAAPAASPSSSCFLHMNQQEQLPITAMVAGLPGHSHLFHRSKSWTPKLQTIREAPANYAGYGKQLTRLWSKGHLVSTY